MTTERIAFLSLLVLIPLVMLCILAVVAIVTFNMGPEERACVEIGYAWVDSQCLFRETGDR